MRSKMKEGIRNKLLLNGVKCPEALDNTCGIWKAGSCSWSRRCKTPCKNFTLTKPAGKRKNKTYGGQPTTNIQQPANQEPPFQQTQAKTEPEMIVSMQTKRGTGTLVVTPQGKLRLTMELENNNQNKEESLTWLKNLI